MFLAVHVKMNQIVIVHVNVNETGTKLFLEIKLWQNRYILRFDFFSQFLMENDRMWCKAMTQFFLCLHVNSIMDESRKIEECRQSKTTK